MSIKLMTDAFRAAISSSTNKFVLVVLCDNANDQGDCYPSVSMVCEKTSLSDRAVQNSIGWLCDNGFLTRRMREGRSTIYHITDPRTWFTPERGSPPNVVHPTPERGSPPPPNVVHPTPERGSPRTIKEPSIEPSRNRQGQKSAAPPLPDWLPRAAWEGFLEMRKGKNKKPTARALELLIAKLSQFRADGEDIVAVLDQSTLAGWTDLYPAKGSARRVLQSAPSGLGRAGRATAQAAQEWLREGENA